MTTRSSDGRNAIPCLRTSACLSRRALLRAGALGLVSLPSALVSGCNISLPDFTAPAATPVPTPAQVPVSPTPEPAATPTPVPQVTPEPTPVPEPVEQILRISGSIPPDMHEMLLSGADCLPQAAISAGLVQASPSYLIEPDWADSFRANIDSTIWVFNLRQGNNGWDSGQAVTAHDFLASWKMILDPHLPASFAWMLFDIERAREISDGTAAPDELGVLAHDDWTLEIRLVRPRQSLPALLASPLLFPISGPVDENDDEMEGARTECAGNGTFLFDETSESGVSLVRNDNYWNAEDVTLERIAFSIRSTEQAINDFRIGTADVVPVDRSVLEAVRGDASIRDRVRRVAPDRIWMLTVQIDTPPFDDVRVRRAVARLIDRQRLTLITQGRVVSATSAVPNWMFPSFSGASPVESLNFDVDQAYEDLAETTYSDPGQWPDLQLPIPAGVEDLRACAEDLASQLFENLGIEIPVVELEPQEYQAAMREQRYPLAWVEWRYRYPHPASIYADLFGTVLNPDRPVGWQDAGYDELARLADSLTEPEDQAEVYARCEEFLQDRVVYIPLLHPVGHLLVQPWVTNLPMSSPSYVSPPGLFFQYLAEPVVITERT